MDWNRLGFMCLISDGGTVSTGGRTTLYLSVREFGVPHVLLVLLTALPPALWWRRRRNRLRSGPGLCPSCGYDLRATPEV